MTNTEYVNKQEQERKRRVYDKQNMNSTRC